MNEIKLGTPVEVQNIGDSEWHKRIYICSTEIDAVCVAERNEEEFKKGFAFLTILWDKFRPIK